MSIQSQITRIENAKLAIVNAIENKGVTVPPSTLIDGMSDFIGLIPKKPPTDICFYDPYGNLVESWSMDELQNKTELPAPPVLPRLTFQEWNWSLEELKTQNTHMDVCAIYTTTSGLCEFDIIINQGTGLKVYLKMAGEHDWGDGTVDNATSHTYANYGKYTITVDGTTTPAGSSNGGGLTGSTGDNAYSHQVVEVRLSTSVESLGAYALYKMSSLKYFVAPNTLTTFLSSTFAYCYALRFLGMPKSLTSTKDYFAEIAAVWLMRLSLTLR